MGKKTKKNYFKKVRIAMEKIVIYSGEGPVVFEKKRMWNIGGCWLEVIDVGLTEDGQKFVKFAQTIIDDEHFKDIHGPVSAKRS